MQNQKLEDTAFLRPPFLTQISHLPRFISMSLSSSLYSSPEVFSGAKAKTPDANLGRVQDGSPDKIPRSNRTCTSPIHLPHSASGWPISNSTHFPATPGLPSLIQRIQTQLYFLHDFTSDCSLSFSALTIYMLVVWSVEQNNSM